MKIVNFLRDMFGSKTTVNISVDHVESRCTSIAIDVFTLQIAINLIASCIAKCNFKTFINGKENKGDDYYRWNIEPNVNQNSTEFLQKLVSKLLLNNECLVIYVNGEYFVADSFSREEFAVKEDYFEQVTVKDFTFDKRFYMSEVFYYRYNNEDVRTYLNSLMSDYNEILALAKNKYKRAGGRKGVANLEAIKKGDKEYDEMIDKLFSEKFKTYFESENAVINLPKGVTYEEITGEGSKKATNELGDIINLLNTSFASVGQAFRIPPALLRGETANIEDLFNNFLTFCIDPIVDLIETENNRKLYSKSVLKGSYMKIDTTTIRHIDMFAIAEKIDKLIASGTTCIDEIRTAIGLPAKDTDFSKKHWITKNYQDINFIDTGGENSE